MQRDHKNVLVLGTCQMLSGTGRGLFMVTSPAAALAIAPHLALVTLPTALVVVGTGMLIAGLAAGAARAIGDFSVRHFGEPRLVMQWRKVASA